jgi:plastocyanin
MLAGGTQGAEIRVTVKTAAGAPVGDAVVIAVPLRGAPHVAPPKASEIVDQIDQEFVPHVKAILVGSSVFFPNKDNVRHHVYSFSPPKVFDLPLYAGTPARPVVFDKPGVVVLGCNIHDWMEAYVYVSESPYYVKTAASGGAVLRNLPADRYTVRVWHPLLESEESATQQSADLSTAAALDLSWSVSLRTEFRIRRPPAGEAHMHY